MATENTKYSLGWIMRYSKNYNYAASDEMVDISGSYLRDNSSGSRYSDSSYNNNNKNRIIIASIIAGAVIALGVAGFFIFNALNPSDNNGPKRNSNGEFIFADNTKISGVDISGKTIKDARELLESNKTSFIKPVKISVNVAGTEVALDQNDFEYTYNIDEVLDRVEKDAEEKKSTSGKEYTVEAKPTDDSISSKTNEICEQYNKEATDAYVSKFHPFASNRFEFAGEQNGFTIDGGDLKKKISTSLGSGKSESSIEALTTEEKAEVTADFLKKNIVELGSYDTTSYNTENGTENMRIALKACNGSIIAPDEQWSFNTCTGDSNLESNGYKPAHVISEGKIIDGIGGGICQASSTIYNAAIKSNMKIVERYNHKWASAYVPSGLDATIDYPALDLTLQNITKYQMFLECKVEGNVLYATFWGYQDPSYDEIKTDNQMTDSNKSSYTVKAWRIYFKDGKEVKREELPESKYDLDNGSGFSADDDLDTDSDDSSNSSGSSGSGSAGTEAQTQTAPASQGEQSGGASQQSSSGDGGGEQSPPQTEAQAAQPENESPQP